MTARVNTPGEDRLGLWQAMRGFGPDTRLFLFYTAIKGVTFGVFMLTFNLYASAIGFDNTSIGLLNALPAIGMFAVGLPCGMLADRFGYKPFLLLGTALTALAPLAIFTMPVNQGIWTFTLVRSVGNPLVWVLSGPMLAALSRPRERVHLFSVNAFLMTATGALGNLIGGWLPEWYAQWAHISVENPLALRTAFAAVIALNALIFCVALRIHAPQPLGRTARNDANATPAVVSRGRDWGLFARLIVPSALIGLGAGAFITFQQLYFHQRFTLSPGPIAAIFAISQVVTALAILVTPWLAERLGRVRATVVTEAISIPLLVVLGFTTNLNLALGAFYARGALMNMSAPVSEALAMDLLPANQRATYTSLQNALGNLGRGGLGPLISGALQGLGGYGAAFSFTALTYAVASAMYFTFFRRAEPDRHIFGWLGSRRARLAGNH